MPGVGHAALGLVASARFCWTAWVGRASTGVGLPLPPQGSSADYIFARVHNGI